MPRIRKLDPSLVNKIAAGEVIERPASVVKELVENALDAGATRIDVALEDGGSRLIRVTDNGCGMDREDLVLAVTPHATSKIRTSDDLFHIRSLGFRGEALASIASVSQLRVCSRPSGQIEAFELIPKDGVPVEPRPCAAPEGTTIEVRNLFYNVPARRKFLRRAPTEIGHVTEQIARLALAHPSIAFTMSHNGRASRNLPATEGRRTRIADFYGTEVAESLMIVDKAERGVHIQALIAPPAQSRATTKWQYYFLNGRYITDRRIGYAVREAFRGLVEPGRFPVAFIFLEMDPEAFDVNVHPTKIEVRWQDAGLIQSQVLAVLRETLLSHDLSVPLRASTPIVRDDAAEFDEARQQRTREALAGYLKSVDPTQVRLDFQPPRFPTANMRPSIHRTFCGPDELDLADRPVCDPTTEDRMGGSLSTRSPREADARPAPPEGMPVMPPTGKVVQIHNAYLVAQTEDGMVIVDQHALHERILYEQFREQILKAPLESQGLLMPEGVEVSPAQAQAAEEHEELLRRLGIELACFGPDGTLAIQGFPSLLQRVDMVDFVSDLLDKLVETGSENEETLIHAALDMMACKAAVKAGDPLTTEEMHALLAQRHLTERSSNCPHGRPTTLQLSTRDLEKQFKRG